MPTTKSSVALPSDNSLRRKTVVGALWTFAGYGGAQLLRLSSNLVLTRLLAPEYFGVMALITVLMIGLAMFSDLGIGPNIMQSDRVDDQNFLDTAFTLQFIRGCFLWVVCVIGAYPFALAYNDIRLAWLVPVVGLSVIISGLNSTKTVSINRQLLLGRLTIIEIMSQAASALATIAYAWISPTIWALAFGMLFGGFLKMLASHFMLPGRNNRFHWEPDAVRSLIRFGRWIFLGTLLTFTSNSAGSLILGKLVSMTDVGIFSIAVTLAKVVEQAYEQLSNKVLLPVFVRIKDLPHVELKRQLRKVRLGAMALFLPPLWFMAIFGDKIIGILFDRRYHSGGWILQVFSAFSMLAIINGTGTFYLAKGNSFLMMNLSAVRLTCYLGAICVGWLISGSTGVIVGMAAYLVPVYAVELWVQRSYEIAMPELDLLALAVSGSIIGLGLWLSGQF